MCSTHFYVHSLQSIFKRNGWWWPLTGGWKRLCSFSECVRRQRNWDHAMALHDSVLMRGWSDRVIRRQHPIQYQIISSNRVRHPSISGVLAHCTRSKNSHQPPINGVNHFFNNKYQPFDNMRMSESQSKAREGRMGNIAAAKWHGMWLLCIRVSNINKWRACSKCASPNNRLRDEWSTVVVGITTTSSWLLQFGQYLATIIS